MEIALVAPVYCKIPNATKNQSDDNTAQYLSAPPCLSNFSVSSKLKPTAIQLPHPPAKTIMSKVYAVPAIGT